MYDDLIGKAIEYINTLFKTNAGGHDADHTMRVYAAALQLSQAEPGCNKAVVGLAALLHDADDYKLFRTENNANARAFLKEHQVPPDEIDEICNVINAVSFSKNKGNRPRTIEAAVVQDADRLDAIGAIGIARTFAYGGEHGRSLNDSVAHFHEKLLLLKDMMNTETARKIAEKRHRFLEAFLSELQEECESAFGVDASFVS